jgi:chromosome partitioning protein
MRLDARTKAAEVLAAWARKLELPFIGVLRETQAYVRSIEHGLTLFDFPKSQVQGDLAQWQSILTWLDPVFNSQPVASVQPKPQQTAPAPAETAPMPLRPTRPIVASTRQDVRPTEAVTPMRPKQVVTRAQPARPAIGARIGQFLDTLPIPRFLQRNS